MTWILIDGPWLAYRARYSVGLDGMLADDPSLLAFGMLDMLRSLCLDSHIKSNNVVFFFDSKMSLRKKMFPGYKASRVKRTEDEIHDQRLFHKALDDFQVNILPAMGIPVYREQGYEADDLISSAASNVHDGDGAVIVSADQDLWQCLDYNIDWYNATTQQYVTRGLFRADKKVDPTQWADVKAMAGCTSDDIPGIPGVGEKSAIDYINRNLAPGTSRYRKIHGAEGQQIIKDTMELVKLPLRGCPNIRLTELTVWSRKGFKEICDQYGFDEFQQGGRRFAWNKVMRGNVLLEQMQRARQRKARV